MVVATAVVAVAWMGATFGTDSRDGDDWINHRPA